MTPRVDLIAPPMAGHLHPVLGVARGLADEFDVRVVSSDGAQAEIAAAGLHGRGLLPGRDAEVRAIVEPEHAVGSHPWRLHRQLRANLGLLEEFQTALTQLWTAEGPPALVLADFTLPVAGTVARAFGVPWWTTHPSPCVIETADGPPAYLGGWSPGRSPLGALRDAVGRHLVRVAKRSAHRLHRTAMRRLDLDAIYRADGTEAVYSPDRVFALGLPAIEFPRRWPTAVELVGPVLYTPPASIAPPPFVDGRAHVLVTIGTHLPWMKDAMAAAAAVAARALPGVEVHFSDGRGAPEPCDSRAPGAGDALPPNFHRLRYVSYGRDLMRYALVVHHGGAGVMYHTLAAGTPALVTPLDYDQFDHAARLEAAGVARRVRDLRQLASAITAALGDRELRAACQRAATAVAASDAVAVIRERVRQQLRRRR